MVTAMTAGHVISTEKISAGEYLSYRYKALTEPVTLPLPDEPFTALWKEAAGEDALHFLSDSFKLPVDKFPLKSPSALKIHFASTEAKLLSFARKRPLILLFDKYNMQ